MKFLFTLILSVFCAFQAFSQVVQRLGLEIGYTDYAPFDDGYISTPIFVGLTYYKSKTGKSGYSKHNMSYGYFEHKNTSEFLSFDYYLLYGNNLGSKQRTDFVHVFSYCFSFGTNLIEQPKKSSLEIGVLFQPILALSRNEIITYVYDGTIYDSSESTLKGGAMLTSGIEFEYSTAIHEKIDLYVRGKTFATVMTKKGFVLDYQFAGSISAGIYINVSNN